jgi:hypothetical protein
MREGTTSRVMATDRPYGEFYDFYSVNPEYFGYDLVDQRVSTVISIQAVSIFKAGEDINNTFLQVVSNHL